MSGEKDINTQNIISTPSSSSKETISNKSVRLMGIKLGEDEFMVNVLRIQEVVRTVDITVVPGSDKRILGIINLRDNVVPVIDLRMMFRMGNTELSSSTKIMVLRNGNEGVGILIDNISHMITLDVSSISEATSNIGFIGQEYLIGISTYNGKSVAILDVDKIIGKKQDNASSFEQRVSLGLLIDTPNKELVKERTKPEIEKIHTPSKEEIDRYIESEVQKKLAERLDGERKKLELDKSSVPSKEQLNRVVESEVQKRLSEELNKIKSMMSAIPTQEQIDQLVNSEVQKRVSHELEKINSVEQRELTKKEEPVSNSLSDDELAILGSRGTISSTEGVYIRGSTHFSGIRVNHDALSKKADKPQKIQASTEAKQKSDEYSYTDEVPYSEPMQLDATVQKHSDEELGYVEPTVEQTDYNQSNIDDKIFDRQPFNVKPFNIKTETIKMPPFAGVPTINTQGDSVKAGEEVAPPIAEKIDIEQQIATELTKREEETKQMHLKKRAEVALQVADVAIDKGVVTPPQDSFFQVLHHI